VPLAHATNALPAPLVRRHEACPSRAAPRCRPGLRSQATVYEWPAGKPAIAGGLALNIGPAGYGHRRP